MIKRILTTIALLAAPLAFASIVILFDPATGRNLRQIDSGKQQWAIENKKSDTATPTSNDVLLYIKNEKFPTCPADGTYTVGAVNTACVSGLDTTRGMTMPEHRIFAMPFAKVYPAYVQKAERKHRTKAEVDQIICWLTGYDMAGLQRQIKKEVDIKTFFAEAPAMHPNTALITGVVCGVRVENVEDPLMRKIRYLDKLVDELAKGRAMDKILRQ